MKKSENMNETSVTDFGCEFCNRKFAREKTLLSHICETKHRWLEKDKQANRIAYQTFVEFYKKHTAAKKQKTQLEFIKSAYYLAFIKFGNYCVSTNCINVNRYSLWLLQNNLKLDNWCLDKNYTQFLIEFLRTEDAFDAISRGVETCIALAESENIQPQDILRYGNTNRICHNIATGKLSPWLLYCSDSGIRFLETLNPDQVKMINDYINPEQWALKFHREPDLKKRIIDTLKEAGY